MSGGGGREHALAWRLAREPGVDGDRLRAGNPGMTRVATLVAVDPADPDALLAIAERERIDLTVIGPELPLDRGVVDRFHAAGRRIFGPPRAAAQLECSKAFAKDFMARHGIPTARYRVCADAAERARGRSPRASSVSRSSSRPTVWPPARVSSSPRPRAKRTPRFARRWRSSQFGAAGARLVIEECLVGPEVSFFALCDGTRAVPLTSAQDHKRIFDDDRGPNTGGMGAFAPSPLDRRRDAGSHHARDRRPRSFEGMRAEGIEYRGFLYAGLMLTVRRPEGHRVQRAFRRSRGAGGHAAHRQRLLSHLAGRRGRTAVGRRR